MVWTVRMLLCLGVVEGVANNEKQYFCLYCGHIVMRTMVKQSSTFLKEQINRLSVSFRPGLLAS